MADTSPSATVGNGLTWRNLNREGCEMGRTTRIQVDDLSEKVRCMESKLDRLTWALVGATITFGTAALMLALNLIF